MEENVSLYRAIICKDSAPEKGKKATIRARTLDEAKDKLEGIYGVGSVFSIYSEEDADRPR